MTPFPNSGRVRARAFTLYGDLVSPHVTASPVDRGGVFRFVSNRLVLPRRPVFSLKPSFSHARTERGGNETEGFLIKRSHSHPALTTVGDIPKPPASLQEHGRRLWVSIQYEYEIRDSGGQAILEQACRCLDRAEQCAALVASDGPTVTSKGTYRENPHIKLELTSRSLCCRLLSRLGVAIEPVRLPGRPAAAHGISFEALEHMGIGGDD